MGKGSSPAPAAPPPPPDYTGAAVATAAGNRDAAIAGTEANRVNQYTPYGNLVYNQIGKSAAGNPLWSATQTLSAAEQSKLDKNNALASGLLDTAGKGLGQVDTMLSDTSLDESKLAQPSIQGQAVQDAVMSRLRPELDRQQAGLDTQLANQGIMRGSEAWQTAQTQQGQRSNDLMTQAALQGISTGQQARQQGIQEQREMQDRPLNVVNALRTGNQVQGPQFTNVPQQQGYGGPDLLGAAQAGYNGQMNQYNAAMNQQAANDASGSSMMSGLFGLGGAALGGPMGGMIGKGIFGGR